MAVLHPAARGGHSGGRRSPAAGQPSILASLGYRSSTSRFPFIRPVAQRPSPPRRRARLARPCSRCRSCRCPARRLGRARASGPSAPPPSPCWRAGIGAGTATSSGGGPREDANLIATRPASAGRRWIVAHLDTKAQGHSMAGRLVAVWLAAGRDGARASRCWRSRGSGARSRCRSAVAGGGHRTGRWRRSLAAGRLAGQSPGARDNGTGVVAALTVAEATRDPGLGVLITGAEEFGLVGARVLARERAGLFAETGGGQPRHAGRDRARSTSCTHDAPGRRVGRAALAPRSPGSASRCGRGGCRSASWWTACRSRAAGAAALTVARLDWATLRRIHTSGDTAEDLGRSGRTAGAGTRGRIESN